MTMKTKVWIDGYTRKDGTKVKGYYKFRKTTHYERSRLSWNLLCQSGFFSEENQNRLRYGGQPQELKNTENEVELINKEGVHIRWLFKQYPDGNYYACQLIKEELPEPHWQVNKEDSLGKDEQHARRMWNSVIRHRRDLNEKSEFVEAKESEQP